MSRNNAPPFGRGYTAYGGNAIDTNNLQFAEILGRQHLFEDINWTPTGGGTALKTLTGFLVTCQLVRNNSAAVVLPKRLIKLDPADPTSCTGYSTALADPHLAVADEYLPAAGAPIGDVFWAVVKGPTTCITPHTGDFAANIVAGDWLVSGATSSGFHGRPQSSQIVTTNSSGSPTTTTTDSLFKATRNTFGKAIGAAVTTAVDTDIRVFVRPDY